MDQHYSITWAERWDSVRDLPGGGQGDAKVVKAKDQTNSQVRFLKVLRQQNELDRRKRMFREVSSYGTLDHPLIPKLIDTNVEVFADLNYKLYLVTEFIEGVALGDFVRRKGPLAFEPSVQLVMRLLDVVQYCHENEVYHRDVKPDNILLRNGDPDHPVLVDFGLSFNNKEVAADATFSGEELGNRFCRLPELAGSSSAKRDPRSDVTFCAAVLVYLLTGELPSVLEDEQRKMPHQRETIRALLDKNTPKEKQAALYAILDQSFQTDVRLRWQRASDLRRELDLLLSSARTDTDTIDAIRGRIDSYLSRPHIAVLAKIDTQLIKALEVVDQTVDKLASELKGNFSRSQTNFQNQADKGFVENSIAFTHRHFRQDVRNWITFRAEAVGNEIVLSATYRAGREMLARVDLENPTFGQDVTGRIRGILYRQIADIIS